MPMLNYTTFYDDTEVANAAHVLGDRYDGWVITSELWESFGQGIVLPINPERLTINQPTRGHEYEAYFGKTASSGFNRRKQTHFDVFNLTLTFNSGYIIPKYSLSTLAGSANNPVALAAKDAAEAVKVGNIYESDVSDYVALKTEEYKKNNVLRARWPKPSQAETISRAYPRINPKEIAEFYEQRSPQAIQPGQRHVAPTMLGISPGFYDDYVPAGTQNLYALLNLIDGPKTWRPNLAYNDVFSMATPNRIKVYANSLLFPSMTFYCLALDQGISWTESAENPTSFDTTINLLCTATDPKLGRGQLQSLVSTYKTYFNIGTFSRFMSQNQSTYVTSAANNGTEF